MNLLRNLFLPVLIGALFHSFSHATPLCPAELRQLVSLYQKATVGKLGGADPVVAFKASSSDPDTHYQWVVRELEDELIQVIESTAPEFREEKIEEISENTGLSPAAIQSLIDYYAIEIYEDPQFAGHPEHVWNRLEDLHRSIRLTEPEKNSPESRYLAYLYWSTQESVPEMAKRFGTSEGKLRNELSALRLSLVDEFKRSGKLDSAIKDFESGKSIPDIAKKLGLGEQALTFALHYQHELNRGVPWDRLTALSPYGTLSEASLAARLREAGNTYAQIADALNKSFGTSPSDPLYRTEGAVAAKMDQLGLTVQRTSKLPTDVKLPKYGQVKRNGHLVPETTRKYLREHFLEPIETLAADLGVTPQGLKQFVDRHGILLKGNYKEEAPPQTLPTPTKAAKTNSPGKTARSPTPEPRLSSNTERRQRILKAYEEQRRTPPKPPISLDAMKKGANLADYTDEELDALLMEAAEKIGGIDKLSTGPSFIQQPFSPASGGKSAIGETLLREHARRTWVKEHPGKKSAPAKEEIFKVKSYSAKEVINRFKTDHGGTVRERKSQERAPISLQNMPDKPFTKFTDEELEQTLLSAAEKLGGIDKLAAGPNFMAQPFSPSSGGESRHGRTLLSEYAIRTWVKANPAKKQVPTTGGIFGVEGYSAKEVIDRFITAHGGSVRERKSQELPPHFFAEHA
jgi:hypothetical protein